MYQECILYVSWMYHDGCINVSPEGCRLLVLCLNIGQLPLLPLKNCFQCTWRKMSTWAMLLICLLYWMYHGCIKNVSCYQSVCYTGRSLCTAYSLWHRTCREPATKKPCLIKCCCLQKGFWKFFLKHRDRALPDHGCLGELETKLVNLVFKTTLTFSFLTKRIPVTKKWQRF